MKQDWSSWLKRVGILGFLFFLVKGIIWLVVFYLAWRAAK
jgi:DMSO reductase anchor subunit